MQCKQQAKPLRFGHGIVPSTWAARSATDSDSGRWASQPCVSIRSTAIFRPSSRILQCIMFPRLAESWQILIPEDKRRAPKPDTLRAPQRRRTEPSVSGIRLPLLRGTSTKMRIAVLTTMLSSHHLALVSEDGTCLCRGARQSRRRHHPTSNPDHQAADWGEIKASRCLGTPIVLNLHRNFQDSGHVMDSNPSDDGHVFKKPRGCGQDRLPAPEERITGSK